jgi:hypothetical protein
VLVKVICYTGSGVAGRTQGKCECHSFQQVVGGFRRSNSVIANHLEVVPYMQSTHELLRSNLLLAESLPVLLLQTAAETLGSGKAAMMSSITTSSTSSATTTSTRHISSSISSETATAAGSAAHASGKPGLGERIKEGIHRRTSGGSSSSSSSSSDGGDVADRGGIDGGVASSAAGLGGVGLEGSAMREVHLAPVEPMGGTTGVMSSGINVPASGTGSDLAAGEGLSLHDAAQAPERDVLADVKFEGAEVVRVRQGLLLEPEAAGEMAPVGGAGHDSEEGEGEQAMSFQRMCLACRL